MRGDLEFPQSEYGETGLCVWQNLKHHVCLGIRVEQQKEIFYRVRLGEMVIDKRIEFPCSEIESWGIIAEDNTYRLGVWETRKAAFHELGTIEAKLLSTEVSGRFTGVYFGLYAQGRARLVCRHIKLENVTPETAD